MGNALEFCLIDTASRKLTIYVTSKEQATLYVIVYKTCIDLDLSLILGNVVIQRHSLKYTEVSFQLYRAHNTSAKIVNNTYLCKSICICMQQLRGFIFLKIRYCVFLSLKYKLILFWRHYYLSLSFNKIEAMVWNITVRCAFCALGVKRMLNSSFW